MAIKQKVLFIDAAYLKKNSYIQDNVDENILIPAILTAHDITLQSSLGTYLFEDLKAKTVDDNLNSDEDELIRNYIQPMLVHASVYNALPFISLKLTNKSVSKEKSEYSDGADLSDLKYLRQTVKDQFDFYLERLNEHLRLNYTQFPLYYKYDYYNNITPSGSTYFSGIHVPKRGANGYRDKDCCPKYRL